jgi:uncharacterized C2H2 Zn-finger protein
MTVSEEDEDPWECPECGSLFMERDDYWSKFEPSWLTNKG